MVDLRIRGPVEQRYSAARCARSHGAQLTFVFTEFGAVSVAKLEPTLRLVSEPFAQPRARSQVADPEIERCALFRNAPRPDAVDADAEPVGAHVAVRLMRTWGWLWRVRGIWGVSV